ncbi:MAG: hypothetical protein IPK74_11200 [Deltaproteobacteria bacterium]|nr:hypothetical protein [Deltaproteobacteria bacterium]
MPRTAPATLRLASIVNGHAGLTSAGATALVEAAEVCLDHHGHRSGVSLHVRLATAKPVAHPLEFTKPTPTARRANHDLQDAVEAGAIAVAVAWLMAETDYRVVQRSRKGTGFDYWLGHTPATFDARLEVSGILRGDEPRVAARLATKLDQMTRSDGGGLPGYAVVVEFGAPRASVGEK